LLVAGSGAREPEEEENVLWWAETTVPAGWGKEMIGFGCCKPLSLIPAGAVGASFGGLLPSLLLLTW